VTTIADVRAALAEAVATTGGLNVSAYLRDTIVAPAAQVFRAEMDPRLVLGSSKQAYAFGVRLYVGRTSEEGGQVAVDEYCAMAGATSIRAAVELDTNWPSPAVVDYAQVTQVGETEVVEIAGVQYLVVDFTVEVVW
jgi:hypothetical protein